MKYELKIGRTMAHLWKDGNFTGISIPYKNKENLANAVTIMKALAFVEHLENHPEVKEAPVSPGVPMCKICNRTIHEIYNALMADSMKEE